MCTFCSSSKGTNGAIGLRYREILRGGERDDDIFIGSDQDFEYVI
jgi:hypothetical protein